MSIGTVRVHIRRPLGRAAHLLGRLLGFGAAEVPLMNRELVWEEEPITIPQPGGHENSMQRDYIFDYIYIGNR